MQQCSHWYYNSAWELQLWLRTPQQLYPTVHSCNTTGDVGVCGCVCSFLLLVLFCSWGVVCGFRGMVFWWVFIWDFGGKLCAGKRNITCWTASPSRITWADCPLTWALEEYRRILRSATFWNLGWFFSLGSTKCSISAMVNSLTETQTTRRIKYFTC